MNITHEQAAVYTVIHEPGDATRYEFTITVTEYDVTAGGLRVYVKLPRKLWLRGIYSLRAEGITAEQKLTHHFILYLKEHAGGGANHYTLLAMVDAVAAVLEVL